MTDTGVTLSIVDAGSPAARRAMSQYFDELARRFPGGFAPGDALDAAALRYNAPTGLFVLATSAGQTVGCGAVELLDDTSAEIKRMWISPQVRGQGLGKRLLAHLEEEIRRTGRSRVVLDTNGSLTEAIAMYGSAGYVPMDRYNDNPYAEHWFAKSLTEPGPGGAGYLLDNQQVEAGARFAALSSLFDPVTFRHIEQLGIDVGWRCWEVGVGGPTIPAWLSRRVGQAGAVLATDIDVSWLPADAPFDVLVHDVGTQEPPRDGLDLIHARLVLVHSHQRDQALRWMVRALRPGGSLLLEEADPMLQPLVCPDEYDEAAALANRLKAGFRSLMAERGVDLAFGRRLPRLLRDAGLVDVQADAFFPVGGPACTLLEEATVNQIRDGVVASGLATEDEIDRHLANIRTGDLDLATSPLVSAWGRTPPAATAG